MHKFVQSAMATGCVDAAGGSLH